jgi:Protein of unknown function (DUF3225)
MTLLAEHMDLPAVRAQVMAEFERYEAALMRNDVQALNAFFWCDERVTRYGIADRQLGHDALVRYRAGVPAPTFTRELLRVRVHTFGPDMAVAQCEFTRTDTELHGFQTQTWARLSEGWKIVAAHVSMVPPFPDP